MEKHFRSYSFKNTLQTFSLKTLRVETLKNIFIKSQFVNDYKKRF